jgi:hypothetical protein
LLNNSAAMQKNFESQAGAQSPFMNTYEPLAPAAASAGRGVGSTSGRGGSPFLAEYEGGEGAVERGGVGGAFELFDEIAAGVYEPELDEAVEALAHEVGELAGHDVGLEAEAGDAAEALLGEYLAPLGRSAEALVDRAAAGVGAVEAAGADEAEAHDAIERAGGAGPAGSPAFELFFGAIKKKLKKVASKAIAVAKKGVALAGGALLGPILAKLKPLIRPLLDKVIKFALDKIPAPYRPYARALASKLGAGVGRALPSAAAPSAPSPVDLAAQSAAAASDEPAGLDAAGADAAGVEGADVDAAGAGLDAAPDAPAVPDLAQAQQDVDAEFAELLVAGDPFDREVIGAGPSRPAPPARDPFGELDRARARFQREITELESAEGAGPAIERFAPAVLMAVRTGIKLIGRPRVVGFLGSLIAKFIAPLIGKQGAPGLGRAIADLGLKTLLQAEVSPEEELEAAGQVLASTVEETVRRVAALPESAFESPESLEAFAFEAFQGAVASNFPPVLVRPELRESEAPGVWLALPRRAKRIRYKKHSRVFPVSISPQVAAAVRGFGGSTLSSFFRDRLRLPAGTVGAKMHLYEATPRTRLARVAQAEVARGLGSGERAAWSQLHPLTPEAAGLLLGAPRLGRPLAEAADPSVPSIGQRYYYLEIDEAPARPLGQESHLHVSLDPRRDEVRVCAYLSEPLAQKLAGALRKQSSPGVITAELRASLAHASAAVCSGRSRNLVRVVGRGAEAHGPPGLSRGMRSAARRELGAAALGWVWSSLPGLLARHSAEIVEKTEGPEDGVRLAFTFHAPGGLGALGAALRGGAVAPFAPTPARPGRVELRIEAGDKHGC